VITCSVEDEDLVHRMVPEATVSVLPNGVDTQHFTRRPDSNRSAVPTILFTGVFGYHPNFDALQYFLNDIFPIVRRAVRDCRFVFAGREAGIAASRLNVGSDGVSFISDPEDMRPLFESAWVFAVPLRIGGGTRLKILEAMAMEVPVVSTSVGAEGVPYRPGEQILIGDSPQDFADATIKLLNDSALRTRLTAKAVQFVREKYDWKRVVAGIEPMLSEITQPGSRALNAEHA
jgi:glycosyltransferase involved in cell wall biosynthesis